MPNLALGYLAALAASICWGSFTVPIKLIDHGDGLIFQWAECTAILVVGIITEMVIGTYEVYPRAMIGGAIWCLGNLMIVPVMSTIGMGTGILVSNLFNMATAWICGHFGLDVSAEHDRRPILDYVGFGVLLASGILYWFLRPTAGVTEASWCPRESEESPILGREADSHRACSKWGRGLGFLLAVISGVMFGINMIPVRHLQLEYPEKHLLEFTFSHFLGAWFASALAAILYCVLKRNRPFVNQQLFLVPSMCGATWAIGQLMGFVANAELGLTVSYPIISTLPSMVATGWSVFFLKEIRGRYNYVVLATAFLLTTAGIMCVTLSA